MNRIILSIKPKFSDAIFLNQKKVELRRRIGKNFKKDSTIYIYTSSPVKKLSGEARIYRIENLPIKEIKERYLADAYISSEDFDSYFVGCSSGFIIFLNNIIEYNNKIPLHKLSPANFRPPQSFCYPDKNLLSLIETEKCI